MVRRAFLEPVGRRARISNLLIVDSAPLPLLVAACVSLCGCSNDGVGPPSEGSLASALSIPSNIPTRQADALADGVVTVAEYSQAFQSFVTCADQSGHPIDGVRTDPVSGLITYGVPAGNLLGVPGEPDSSPVGRCYEETFSWVELAFQVTDPAVIQQGIDQQDQAMADEGLACLMRNGFDPPLSVNVQTEEGQLWESRYIELAVAGKC